MNMIHKFACGLFVSVYVCVRQVRRGWGRRRGGTHGLLYHVLLLSSYWSAGTLCPWNACEFCPIIQKLNIYTFESFVCQMLIFCVFISDIYYGRIRLSRLCIDLYYWCLTVNQHRQGWSFAYPCHPAFSSAYQRLSGDHQHTTQSANNQQRSDIYHGNEP